MLIIGHRGAKGLAPEHTIESFQAALDAGVDGIEFDIRTTQDNVAIVCHDKKIGGHIVSRTPLHIIKAAEPKLMTLAELLDFLHNQTTHLVIELKSGSDPKPVSDALIQAKADISLVSISSFDFKLLRKMKTLLPDTTLIVNHAWSGVWASYRARKLGTKFITMSQRWLWSGFIKSVAKRGYKLSAYSIENPAKARKWEKHGLYGCITGYPDRFKD